MQGFRPPGMYLWKPWFTRDGEGALHMFYLQAPQHVLPGQRHLSSSIGHAIQQPDGIWRILPVALQADTPRFRWDGLALWAGSVLELPSHLQGHGRYAMVYTGIGKNNWRVQQLGLAYSDDLALWRRVYHRAATTGQSCYSAEFFENDLGAIGAWRDPFLFWHDGRLYAAVTARVIGEADTFNGCIGLLSSADLANWQYEPPMLVPGDMDQMNRPQLVHTGGHWYLFFTCGQRYRNRPDQLGLATDDAVGWFCYYSVDSPLGPYAPVNGGNNGLVFSNHTTRDLRLIEPGRDGTFMAIGWDGVDGDGQFIGALSAPYQVAIDGDRVVLTVGG